MKRRAMAAFAAFLCIVSVLGSDMQAKAADIHETELENYILEEMAAAHIPGMAISIVSAQREQYCAAYGSAQRTEADYVLGSLSKSFTAAAILNMAEDDDLSLDDKVSDYLEGYGAISDVSIRELLHHTSGIGADETMSGLKGTGTRGEFTYAHANYNLLGEIVEVVSGISYEEYISDNILDPLDMTSTYSLRNSGGIENGLLVGYQNYFGFPFASKYQYDAGDDWMQVPSGYLISDVKDMGKYLQMYLKGGEDVLTPESIDAMLYDGVDTSSDMGISEDLFGGSAKYGMGWIEKEVYGEPLLFHSGQTENFMSMMVLMPERDLGIVMLFHSQDVLVGREMVKTLEEGIVSIEMGQDAEKVPEDAYLIRHGIIDIILLCAIFLVWMPIFLIGIWIKRRREKLIFVPALCIDAAVHLLLPTVLLLVLPQTVAVFLLKRFVPDVYFVIIAVIFSLYFGALVKLCVGAYIAIRGDAGGMDKEDAKKEGQEGTEYTKEEKISYGSESPQGGEQQKEEKGCQGTGEEKTEEEGKTEEKEKQESQELKAEENSSSSGAKKEKQNPETKEDGNGGKVENHYTETQKKTKKTEKDKKESTEEEEKNNGSKENGEQEETGNDRTAGAGLKKASKDSNRTEKTEEEKEKDKIPESEESVGGEMEKTEEGGKKKETPENGKTAGSEVKETKGETPRKKEENRKESGGAETGEGKRGEREEKDRKESGKREAERAKEPEQGKAGKRTEGTEKRKGKAERQGMRKKTVAKEKRRREQMRVAARRKSQKEQVAKAMAEKSQKEQAATAVREKSQRGQTITAEKGQRGLKQEAETEKCQSRQRKAVLKEKSRREKKRALIKRKK